MVDTKVVSVTPQGRAFVEFSGLGHKSMKCMDIREIGKAHDVFISIFKAAIIDLLFQDNNETYDQPLHDLKNSSRFNEFCENKGSEIFEAFFLACQTLSTVHENATH